MINLKNSSSFFLISILLFFSFPLAIPSFEYSLIFIQFLLFVPIFIFLKLFQTNLLGILLVFLYLFLLLLVPFDMPGSVVGWMSMLCVGYFFGEYANRDGIQTLKELRVFVLSSILLTLWILFQNYQNSFSYDLLSDYFAASSINTVPILMVCLTNLFCVIYFHSVYFNEKYLFVNLKFSRKLLFLLFLISSLSVIIFELRSGIGIFFLWSIVIWNSFGHKSPLIKYFLLFALVTIISLFYVDILLDLILSFLVPGRENLASLTAELSEGALRYDEIITFWEVAGVSNKLNFHIWSENFSVSGMSDFIAALFPISLLIFIPFIWSFKIIKKVNKRNRNAILIIFTSMFSSLFISVLQPDFFSMFTFFAIVFYIFFAERKKILHSQIFKADQI